jgi:two-component system, cell cycle response regulator
MHAHRILIVDDDAVGRESLEALLATQGHQLLFAENGTQALRMAEQHRPDLVLLDVMMPGMNGFEVCRQLRAHAQLAEVPILMLTALDDDQSRLQGLQAGADDFISKPYQVAELRTRIKTITRLNRYRLLTEERAKSAWIIEHAEEAYLLTDLADRIRYANPRARLYLQLLEENSQGIPFLKQAEQYYQTKPEDLWRNWPLDAQENQEKRYLLRPESATATALWLEVSVRATDADERLLCLRDVSEKITAQRNMQSFHGMIQHKLRTPLEPLISGLAFLLRTPSIDEKTRNEFIDMALYGARQLHDQINEVFHYLDSGRVLNFNDPVSIVQIADYANESAFRQGIELTLHVAPTLQQEYFPLTPGSLQWIVWELLENAKKFHPNHTPCVEFELLPNHDSAYACLRCSDDGLHLSPAQLAQVWTPYYQGEKYFTGQSPGMGLGLPTIAKLVWQIGGQCRCYNRADRVGVVVELSLPLFRPPQV